MQPRTKKTLVITGVLTAFAVGGATLQAEAAGVGTTMKKSTKSKSSATKSSATKSSTATSSKSSSAKKAQTVSTDSAAATNLNVISYNIKYGEQYRGKKCTSEAQRARQRAFYDQVAATVQSADVVALQEVDKDTERSCGHDQATAIANRLTTATGKTWRVCFAAGKEIKGGGHQGNAVLTAHPTTTCKKVHLGNDPDDNEKRIAARASLSLNGKRAYVYSAHVTDGTESERVDARADQVKKLLADMAKHNGKPTIAAGDFNATYDKSIAKMREQATDVLPGAGVTDATMASGSQLDHVFTIGTNTASAAVLQTDPTYKFSDHLPIQAVLSF